MSDRSWTPSPGDRATDPEFFELDRRMFWPRVWQMAGRLAEIPNPGDYAEYEIRDQSIVSVRGYDMQLREDFTVRTSGTSRAAGFDRHVNGCLVGLPDEKLLLAIRMTNMVIDVPIADLNF